MSVADHARVAEWLGETASHAFAVEVILAAGGIYEAEIRTSARLPGAPSVDPGMDQPELVRCDNLDALRDLTRQRIAARCGEILDFRESSN